MGYDNNFFDCNHIIKKNRNKNNKFRYFAGQNGRVQRKFLRADRCNCLLAAMTFQTHNICYLAGYYGRCSQLNTKKYGNLLTNAGGGGYNG